MTDASTPTKTGWTKSLFGATALAALLVAAPMASAQDGAQPRDVPEGFVVPGPAPTNAPDASESGANDPASSGNAAPSPSGETETSDNTAETTAPTSRGGSLAPTRSTVVGEGRTAANPMAFATAPETGTTDWPCVQRRVETIQPAQMWAGPDLAIGNAVERTPEMRALVDRAIARRISSDEAQTLVRDFLLNVPASDREAVSTALFSDMLDRLNAERGQVMNGILRYGSRQKALAEALREKSRDMARIRQEGDATAFADIREQMQWDTRVFDDRRQSLTYVCEVPILIEQRAFSLGRELSRDLG